MSRQDYELIAEVLRRCRGDESDLNSLATLNCVSHAMAECFARRNSKFDTARFLKACGAMP